MKTFLGIISQEGFALALGFTLASIVTFLPAIWCFFHAAPDYGNGFMGGGVILGIISAITGIVGFCLTFHIVADQARRKYNGY